MSTQFHAESLYLEMELHWKHRQFVQLCVSRSSKSSFTEDWLEEDDYVIHM